MTTRSHSSALPSLPPTAPSSAAGTFSLFPLLPTELQIAIFRVTTHTWMTTGDDSTPECLLEWPKRLPFGIYFQVNKSRLEWYTETNINPRRCARSSDPNRKPTMDLLRESEETIWVLPPLLGVCGLARGVVYDTLTDAEKLCGKGGGDVDLYCEDCYDPAEDDYGLRIQDFRRPGLGERVAEEDERLEKSEAEKDVWKTKLEHQNGRHEIVRGRSWVVLPKCPYYKNPEWAGRLVVSDEGRVVEDHS